MCLIFSINYTQRIYDDLLLSAQIFLNLRETILSTLKGIFNRIQSL